MRRLVIVALLVLFSGEVHAEVTCLGPSDAKHYMMYVHGMDTYIPARPELRNRRILKGLAEKLSIRWALPRGNAQCSSDKKLICWAQNNQQQLKEGKKIVEEAAKKCFPRNVKFGVLGYSNGAFFVLRTYQYNISTWSPIIAWSASGSWRKGDPPITNKSSTVVLVLDRKDRYHWKSAQQYINYIKSIGGNLDLVKFHGGHNITKGALEKVLSKFIIQSN